MNREFIVRLLRTNDRAVGRALSALNRRQTQTEQVSQATINRNGRGFRPAHARMGTSMAQFYERTGYLTTRQVDYWRRTMRDGKMRIEIYANQLLNEAQARAAAQQAAAQQ